MFFLEMGSTLRARWISWDPVLQSLPSFLTDWKPSSTYAPEIEWLCISRVRANQSKSNGTHALMAVWEALCIERKNAVTATDLDFLASKHKVLSRKWLIYLPPEAIDAAWHLIATFVLAGKLGDDAKVSTIHRQGKRDAKKLDKKPDLSMFDSETKDEHRKGKSSGSSHVICVYSSNYEDVEDVLSLRDKLHDLGFTNELGYKPDAYTFCGIYWGNQWKILPTIY